MEKLAPHVKLLDKKITDLSDILAHLGRGSDLIELIRIIRHPGWTTPAELAFSTAVLDAMHLHAKALQQLSEQMLAAGKLVGAKEVVIK
jgi:hypothetical protein